MQGRRLARTGLLGVSLALAWAMSAHAEPPSATSSSNTSVAPAVPSIPAGLTREQQIAAQKAIIAERKALGRAQFEQRMKELERRRNPTLEDLREFYPADYEREIKRQQHLAAVFKNSPEMEIRQELPARARKLFAARDFAELDRVYDDYALHSERTPSGLWKSGMWLAALRAAAKSDEAYVARDELLQQWLRERPQSALARLLRADLMVTRAWAIRGDGYAASVEERNWRPFFDWLGRAQDYLDAEKAIVAARPEYYEQAIDLLRARQKSPFAIFDEGLEKFPAYYPMYFAMLQSLLPKWHGSAEQIEHFTSEAVARTQKTEGRGMYARMYWYVSQIEYKGELFLDTRANWERMRAGFDDVIARYPDQWNLQNYASFACEANDKETLKKLFERIREPSLDEAWYSRERYVACGRRVGKFSD